MKKIETKKIECGKGRTKKLSGNGEIGYQLWVDDEGKLYVQIEDTNVPAGSVI